MNEIQVTVRGNVASDPRQIQFDDGNILTSFRVASNARYFDRGRQQWVDRGASFFTVNCRRALAVNAAASIRKGQPVVVVGRLRERSWTVDDVPRRTVEIEAEALGHDLYFGTAAFDRVMRVERIPTRAEEDALIQQVHSDTESPIDVTGLAVLDEVGDPAPDDGSDGGMSGMDDDIDGLDGGMDGADIGARRTGRPVAV